MTPTQGGTVAYVIEARNIDSGRVFLQGEAYDHEPTAKLRVRALKKQNPRHEFWTEEVEYLATRNAAEVRRVRDHMAELLEAGFDERVSVVFLPTGEVKVSAQATGENEYALTMPGSDWMDYMVDKIIAGRAKNKAKESK